MPYFTTKPFNQNTLRVMFNWDMIPKRVIQDTGLVEKLAQELNELASVSGRNLLLDWTGLKIVPAEFFGKLISLHKLLARRNDALIQCCIKDDFKHVLEITKLDAFFNINEEIEPLGEPALTDV